MGFATKENIDPKDFRIETVRVYIRLSGGPRFYWKEM